MIMIKKLCLAALLLAPSLSLFGCGYALVGKGSNIPDDVKSVYLQPLVNRTQRQQVEQELTQAIAQELVTRQRFAVVSAESEATAEIGGAVTGFGVTPVTFDNTGRATAYEISITAQVVFKRTGAEGKVIWKSDNYTFRENYPVEATQTAYIDLENGAIEKASKQFAETLVTSLLEGF
ncbi:MAG TPA: LptE family protein [Thermoanaerobaculia bacterium]|nr:LptE family protein [Thermoanaerobaculia bacterium]